MTDQFSPLRPAYARLVLWWICLLVAWGAFTGLVVWALTVGRSMMWQDVGIGASAMAGTFAIWRVRVHGVRRATPDETGLSQDLIRLQKVTSLGRLARGVTHDLNNLLVPILGNAELLSGGTDLTDDVRRRIGDVHHAAEVASALLRQVQVYAGEDTSSVEPVDLNELVIEIESLLRAATPRNVAMEFDLAESSLLINADRCQVRQVIVNLVENAAEAMAGRKGTVTVRTASAEMTASQCASMGLRPGQHVIMEVVDVGCGMDEHVQAMLFEPFFTTRSPGRGLGMTVARDIMIGHSGGIDLQSQVDQGTTIRLVFPRVEDPVSAALPEPSQPAELLWQATGRILVVDESADVREAARAILEHHGLMPLMARNAQQAVEIFREQCDQIDLVLLGIGGTSLASEEVFASLREISSEARIVLCSAQGTSEGAAQASRLGANAWVDKPFDVKELITVIRSLTEARP